MTTTETPPLQQEKKKDDKTTSTTTSDDVSEQHWCIDVWSLPSDKFHKLKGEERFEFIRQHKCCHLSTDGPFPANSLTTPADITWLEEMVVVVYFLIILGGPLVWIFSVLVIAPLTVTTLKQAATVVGVSLVLAIHPLPSEQFKHERIVYSWFTTCLYKYFSYRFVWDGNSHIKIQQGIPWIGAGAPHGVLPLSGILSIPGINAVAQIDFVGAVASVVKYTPFLRYMTIYPTIPVSSAALKQAAFPSSGEQQLCCGLVPDGIAGIFRQHPHREVVALLKRKGLARHALRTGTNILPAYSFGNTEILNSWWDKWGIMERWSRRTQTSIFLYWGRAFLPIPRRVQITMVYGDCIIVDKLPSQQQRQPTPQEVDELHQQILEGIRHCFETHKSSLGRGDKELIFD